MMRLFLATIVARHHQARAFSSTAFQPAKMIAASSPTRLFQPPYSSSRNSLRLFSSATEVDELNEKIAAKGNEIRQLKADGIDKAALAPHVEELLALKAQLPEDQQEQKPKKEKKPKKKKAPAAKKKAPPKKVEEMSESELRLNRLSKVDAMREANIEPFEYTFDQTRSAAQLVTEYDGKLEGGEEDEESDVAVAGRIMTRRVFGKLAFFTLQDETGTIQLQFDKKRLGDTFKVRVCLGKRGTNHGYDFLRLFCSVSSSF